MQRMPKNGFGFMSIMNRNQVLFEKMMDQQNMILKGRGTICGSPRRGRVLDSGRDPTDHPRRLGGIASGNHPIDFSRSPGGIDSGRCPTEMIQLKARPRFKMASELGLQL